MIIKEDITNLHFYIPNNNELSPKQKTDKRK